MAMNSKTAEKVIYLVIALSSFASGVIVTKVFNDLHWQNQAIIHNCAGHGEWGEWKWKDE